MREQPPRARSISISINSTRLTRALSRQCPGARGAETTARSNEIGLCNVTVAQIEEARRIVDIQSIQVELSVWQDANVLSGVAEYCISHGLTLLAHRPLGVVARGRERPPIRC